MSTNIVTKTAAFTIADTDIGTAESVTYMCTGAFAITIPATGVTAGNQFFIKSTDGLQTFTEGGTVTPPLYMSVELYGDEASVGITCTSTGNYEIVGDLASTVSALEGEVSFKAVLFSDQTLTNNTWTQIQFDSEEYDNGDNFDTSTYGFTAPVAGTYVFNASVGSADNLPADTEFRIRISVNSSVKSTSQRTQYGTAETYVKVDADLNIQLAAGDVVSVDIRQISGGNMDALAAPSYTQFSGHLLTSPITLAPHGVDHIFSVHRGGTDQTPSSYDAFVKVEWTTIKDQINVNFDLTNNRFVVPSDGWYEFDAVVTCVGTVGDIDSAAIYIDGVGTYYGDITNSNITASRAVITAKTHLKAGQYVEVYAWHGGATPDVFMGIETYTYFTGSKITGSSTGVEYDSYDVAFGVGITTDQSQSTLDTWIPLEFDNVLMDNGGNFDDTNYKFIAPVDGIYQFNALIRIENFDINSTADFLQTRLVIENNGTITNVGAVYRLDPISGERYQSVPSSATFKLQAGATVGVDVYQHLDTTVDYQTTSNFSGHLIRATTKAECSFSADLNNVDDSTSITAVGYTKVPLNHTEFNYGNNFDTVTNNRFDVPEDGRYVFNFGTTITTLTDTTTDFFSALYLNGVLYQLGNRNAVDYSTQTSVGSAILDLVKGDYIELYLYQNESISETIKGHHNQTYLSGYRLVTSQDTPKITSDLSDVSGVPHVSGDTLISNGTVYEPTQVFSDPVYFKMMQGSNATETSVSPGGNSEVGFSVNAYEVGSTAPTGINLTDNSYTAPVAGMYELKGQVAIEYQDTEEDKRIYFQWRVNGSNTNGRVVNIGQASSTQENLFGSTQILLEEGDVVTLQLYSNNATTTAVAYGYGQTYLEGRLVTPPVTLAPHGVSHSFSVHKDYTDQVVSASGGTTVTWAKAIHTENVAFDFTNNQFIAPVSGNYQFNATVQTLNNASGVFILRLKTQGGGWFDGSRKTISSYETLTLNASTYLEAGATAYIELESVTDSSYTIRGSAQYTFFHGYLTSGSSTGIEYDSFDVGFSAYSTDTTTSYDGPAIIDFDTVVYDRGGNFDTTNSEFVAPVAGLYSIKASGALASMTDGQRLLVKLYINDVLDSNIAETQTGAVQNASAFGGKDVYLSAGDTVAIYMQQAGGTAKTAQGSINTYFTCHLVRSTTKAECSFSAYYSGHTNNTTDISATGDTTLTLTATEFNHGNCFNTTTGEFTAPEKGRYKFDFGVGLTTLAAGKEVIARLVIDDVVTYSGSRVIDALTSVGSRTIELDKGSTVALGLYQDDSASETITGWNAYTYLSGNRLSTTPTTIDYDPPSFKRTFLLMGA